MTSIDYTKRAAIRAAWARTSSRSTAAGLLAAAGLWAAASALDLAVVAPAAAQFGPPAAAPRSGRDGAPIDLTGQWVSVVTEDWRFRMVTPPKGDFPGVPLNPAATAIANAWDPARDEAEGNACKAYGAAAIMRVPGRIRIAWADENTLEIETDAGQQTRVLHFGAATLPAGEPTWQGFSKAEWLPQGGGRGRPPVNGSLKVVTTDMRPGYLRKNGVPYSADATVMEYYDVLHEPDGTDWLVVKTIVEDPVYLTGEFITSSNFRRQKDQDGWNPRPCAVK
jgi:hypothetical protein